jgi:cytochrome c
VTNENAVRIYQQVSPEVAAIEAADEAKALEEARQAAQPKPKRIGQLALAFLAVGVALATSYVVLERTSRIPVVPEVSVAGASVSRGHDLIIEYGCGTCHVIPGVKGAVGRVGPNLTSYGERTYIVGSYQNTPNLLSRWIAQPQQLEPGTAMPNLGVSATEAQDMAAYLLQLR